MEGNGESGEGWGWGVRGEPPAAEVEWAVLCSRFFTWRFVTALYVTDIWNDSYSWPLFVYMGTSCVYPLASSCAHTFNSMSKNARHICYFLDYGAVNLFSLGMWGPALSSPARGRAPRPFPWELGPLEGVAGLAEESRGRQGPIRVPGECPVSSRAKGVLANANDRSSGDKGPALWCWPTRVA